ncbi:M20 metallopeptidase family protein [Paenibacillus flagellatus]|uniref:Amidohydrolase n=1 Tax=Paenibacillus flagellatus TaxID=2211139 RepID=A0A2V5KMB0_9BACL|nr:M20 family metallopeptidase [Paenibacillus flagellatus]PYI52027.1 amidohydrolase [Paenibacillus flagellatus]
MTQASLLQPLLDSGKRMEAELVEFRRDLHRNPELSFQESETAAKVAERLRAMGYEVRTGVGGHGIVADLTGAKPGPTIALRADMDALPIQEESGLPYASQRPGVMHACGHDAHTTMLLGAARILLGHKDRIAGKVRFLFQSAEEINQGARSMIEQGALDGVDEIYGLHNLPTLAAGKAATRYGSLMGSVDRIEITLEGKGGHGAIPDQSIDPVVAASAIVMGLQSAVSREISPFDPVVLTIGSLQAGDTYNVIPHRASMTGTIRTFSPRVQASMKERVVRLVGQIAEAYRCKAAVDYIELTPVLVGDDRCVAHVERTIDAAIGADNRIEAAPTLAGEDFSLYLQKVPGCFFWLGSGPREGAENAYGLHHPKFRIEEECLPLGASLLASVALNRLSAG